MRYTVILILMLGCFLPSFSQHHITYKFSYPQGTGADEVLLIPLISDNIYQEFFIADGQYKTIQIGGTTFMEFYNANANERTTLNLTGEQTTVPAVRSQSPIKVLEINPIETTIEILGYTCSGISVVHNNFTIDYYYTDRIKINPKSFAEHTYMDYNKVLDAVNGAVPLQYRIRFNDKTLVATAIEIGSFDPKKESFDPQITFKEFDKQSKSAYKKDVLPLLQHRKNAVQLKSLEASGHAILNEFKLPLMMYFEQPAFFHLTMSVNNMKFLMGFNTEEKWEYNPIEGQVKVEQIDQKEYDKNEIFEAFNPMIKNDWNQLTPVAIKETNNEFCFVVKKQDAVYYYNLSKSNSLITHWGKASSSFALDKYTFIEGIPFPMHIVEYSAASGNVEMEMELETITLNTQISNSLFQIPEELKSKVVYETPVKSLTAADYYNRAENFSNEQKFDSAIVNYKKAIRLESGKREYHNQLGMAYINTEDYYKGIAEFTIAIEIDPEYATAIGNLGYCKMALGDDRHAIDEFNKAIRFDSLSRTHYGNRGLSYFNLGEYETAEKDFRKTISIDPEYGVGYWNVAMSLYNQKKFEEAIYYYNEAFKRREESAAGYNYRGICYYNLEQMDKALIDFKKAISIDDSDVSFYNNLGSTYNQLGDSKLAIEWYEQAIKVDTANASGYNNIGLIYLKENSYDAAIGAFNQAIAINAGEAVYFDNRGHAKAGKMDYQGAIEDYSESIHLYPKDEHIFYLRGIAKINLNDKFDGCKDLKRAKEMGSEEAGPAIEEHCQNE